MAWHRALVVWAHGEYFRNVDDPWVMVRGGCLGKLKPAGVTALHLKGRFNGGSVPGVEYGVDCL